MTIKICSLTLYKRRVMKKCILTWFSIALFCAALASCNKAKPCAAYSKVDKAEQSQVEI